MSCKISGLKDYLCVVFMNFAFQFLHCFKVLANVD